jgi:hypothetical protein
LKIPKLKIVNKEKVKEALDDELTQNEMKLLNESRRAFTDKEISYIEKNKPYLLASNQKEDIREISDGGFSVMSKGFSLMLLAKRFAFYEETLTGKKIDTTHDLRMRSLKARDCLRNDLYFDTLKPIKEKEE